jgi:hypothetical protein
MKKSQIYWSYRLRGGFFAISIFVLIVTQLRSNDITIFAGYLLGIKSKTSIIIIFLNKLC